MTFDKFSDGKSFIHKLDPRVKVLSLVITIIIIAVSNKFEPLVSAFYIGIYLLIFSQLNFRILIKPIFIFNIFILFLWLILPASIPGTEAVRVGSFIISYEGLIYILKITIRSNAILFITIALLGTVSISKLTYSLSYFKIPEKLVYLFFFCYRYITVLFEEFTTFQKVMKARGFKPATNFRTYHTYANLIGVILVRSYEHSNRIYQAMLCRGFKNKFPTIHRFRDTWKDYMFLILFIFIGIILIILEKQ